MKRSSTVFLKVVLVGIAVAVLAGMIRFPQTEGRATNLDLVSIYADPFLIYIYLASILFFVGLFQAFRLLNLIEANKAFTPEAVATLRHMKLASLILIGGIALALLYIRFLGQGEDSAGPTALGIAVSVAFAVIATAAALFEKLLQKAVDMKSEHDLTV